MDRTKRLELSQKINRGEVRLVIIPGWVRSQSDGEYHYITARQLAQLYEVPLNKCLVLTEEQERGFRRKDKDIYLTPRSDGDYTLSI